MKTPVWKKAATLLSELDRMSKDLANGVADKDYYKGNAPGYQEVVFDRRTMSVMSHPGVTWSEKMRWSAGIRAEAVLEVLPDWANRVLVSVRCRKGTVRFRVNPGRWAFAGIELA